MFSITQTPSRQVCLMKTMVHEDHQIHFILFLFVHLKLIQSWYNFSCLFLLPPFPLIFLSSQTRKAANCDVYIWHLQNLEVRKDLPNTKLIIVFLASKCISCSNSTINGYTALHGRRFFAHERIYLDPNQREYWSQKYWPQNNNGWSPILATH